MAKAKFPTKRTYERPCSRCGGTGVDPEMEDCACDCCESGTEYLELTEAQALDYPGAVLVQGTHHG